MKQITILLILLTLPLFAYSQNDNIEKATIGEKAKMKEYLAGAIEEDNGVVIFTKELNAPGLSKAKIPIPPMEEQERIVGILDKFDALVNDILVGLPAEIAARRKQYEYYREKLLNFEPLNN